MINSGWWVLGGYVWPVDRHVLARLSVGYWSWLLLLLLLRCPRCQRGEGGWGNLTNSSSPSLCLVGTQARDVRIPVLLTGVVVVLVVVSLSVLIVGCWQPIQVVECQLYHIRNGMIKIYPQWILLLSVYLSLSLVVVVGAAFLFFLCCDRCC